MGQPKDKKYSDLFLAKLLDLLSLCLAARCKCLLDEM